MGLDATVSRVRRMDDRVTDAMSVSLVAATLPGGFALVALIAQGLRPGALGLAIGSSSCLALGGVLEGVSFGVRSSEPAVFLSSAVLIGIATIVGSAVPAFRTTRIQHAAAVKGG